MPHRHVGAEHLQPALSISPVLLWFIHAYLACVWSHYRWAGKYNLKSGFRVGYSKLPPSAQSHEQRFKGGFAVHIKKIGEREAVSFGLCRAEIWVFTVQEGLGRL